MGGVEAVAPPKPAMPECVGYPPIRTRSAHRCKVSLLCIIIVLMGEGHFTFVAVVMKGFMGSVLLIPDWTNHERGGALLWAE